MKLIKSLIFISLITISVFASENSVKLNGSVKENQYTLKLYYEASSENLILIKDSYTVNDADNKPFDLTKDGRTNLFHLKISGNQSSIVKVKLKSQFATKPFTPSDEGIYKDDDIVPIDYTVNSYNPVPSGYLKDYEAYTFYYSWKGKADLTAGNYSTTVKVTYYVE